MRIVLAVLLSIACCHALSSSLNKRTISNARTSNLYMSGGELSEFLESRADVVAINNSARSSDTAPMVYNDYQKEAVAMFSSYRIPGMLVAGAAYGGSFTMPLSMTDNLSTQLIKRTYVLLGICTVVAQLLTVVISTAAIDKISVGIDAPPARSLREFLDTSFELEWVSMRVNFLAGLLGFALMNGLKAWAFLSCPVFSRSTFLVIGTSVLFMMAMVTEALTSSRDLLHLCQRYFSLLLKRCQRLDEKGNSRTFKQRSLFIASGAMGVVTVLYTIWSYAHVIEFFIYGGLPFHEKFKNITFLSPAYFKALLLRKKTIPTTGI